VKATIAGLLFVGAGFAIVYLPWLAYLYSYTNRVFPVSGEAVRYLGEAAARGTDRYLIRISARLATDYLAADPFVMLVPFVALSFALVSWLRHRDRWAEEFFRDLARLKIFIFFAVFLVVAYVFYVQVHWYLTRYVFSAYLAFLAITCAAIYRVESALGRRGRIVLLVLAAAGPIGAAALRYDISGILRGSVEQTNYRTAGLWARDALPNGTIVGAWESGALSYYAPGLEVVNLDGVLDAAAFEHIKRGDLESYLRERNVEYVLGTEIGRNFIVLHSKDPDLERFQDLGIIPATPGSGPWHLYRYDFAGAVDQP
jgi:hypothetical protein